MRLVLVSLRLAILLALVLGIVSSQPHRIDLVVERLAHRVDLLFRKCGVTQTLNLGANFAMDSGACHANEGPIRSIDTLGELGSTIRTLFVGGMLFGNLS